MEHLNRGCYPVEICGCGGQKKQPVTASLVDKKKIQQSQPYGWLGRLKKKAPITISSIGENKHHSYG